MLAIIALLSDIVYFIQKFFEDMFKGPAQEDNTEEQ